jgi:cytochrome c-type biogenesis protein CcmE
MEPTQTPLRPPRVRAKFIVGGLVIAITILGLIGWAMGRPGSTSFYKTVAEVAEVKALGASKPFEDYRVNGNVVAGSFRTRGLRSSFGISDGSTGDDQLTVVTREPLPDAFSTAYENDPESVEIVAEGRFDGHMFVATKVLAKCPSKFKTQA